MQYHKYSLTEIENMMPWEREVYTSLLIQHIQEEKKKAEEAKARRWNSPLHHQKE